MTELYTKISKELDAEIERIAKERGIKKTDVARELLQDGLEADGMISEAKDAKAKVLALDTVKGDVSELKEEIKSLKAMLESKPKEVSAPRMTKEEIIQHLQTCTDANCEYRAIAQAAKDLERLKEKASEPDLSKGFLMVGDKTFTLDQLEAAKKYAMEFAEAHEDHVDIFYRKGNFKSKEFKSTMFGGFDADFKYGLEEALQDAKKFEKEEKYRLEESQANAKKEAKWLADIQTE